MALLALASLTLGLVGCSAEPAADKDGGQPTAAEPTGDTLVIQPLFYRSDGTGGVGREVLTWAPSDDGTFRLDFSEDEVNGLGDASRAAAWNAAIVSTLLTGEPLEGRFGFEVTGAIDGPSAGALTTVGLMALRAGHTLDDSVTMTGTINATGTIGPVGGIPEKLHGAAEAGLSTILVPLGQRNSVDHTGAVVDLVREGERLGVTVVEVGDVYEAYPLLTGGESLDAPQPTTEPRLGTAAYDKLTAQVTGTLARYDTAVQRMAALSGDVQAMLMSTGVPDQAALAATRAADLQRQGLAAGAFVAAQQAAALQEMTTAAGESLTPLLTQGFDGLGTMIAQMTDTGPTTGKFFSFLDQLATYTPNTVADVEGLVHAYAGAFDAYSLLVFAENEALALQADVDSGAVADLETLFSRSVFPLLYSRLAESQLVNAQALFEVGRDNPGAAVSPTVDVQQVGDFFRRGAAANFAAFMTSGAVPELAEANGLSTDVVLGYLAQNDLDVALSAHQVAVEAGIADYLGPETPNAAYATLAFGLSNYVRNQMLVEKYYNNAIVDESFQVTGVMFEGALNNAIALGRDQLAVEIESLLARGTEPVVAVASYEAGAIGDTDVVARFGSLATYSAGYLSSRVLTYLAAAAPRRKG